MYKIYSYYKTDAINGKRKIYQIAGYENEFTSLLDAEYYMRTNLIKKEFDLYEYDKNGKRTMMPSEAVYRITIIFKESKLWILKNIETGFFYFMNNSFSECEKYLKTMTKDYVDYDENGNFINE